MRSIQWLGSSLTAVFLFLSSLPGYGGVGNGSTPAASTPSPLDSNNINLIFVVSEDLANNIAEDINANTANLTNQGLQRSLLMATFLQKNVLGGKNVTGIYALEPMTHLQTTKQGTYPDMVAMETIQQFALLNQVTVPTDPVGLAQYTGNSFQINVSYAQGQSLPDVAAPLIYCQGCQGLDFKDQGKDNEALIKQVLAYNVPGFYVFSAPWETTKNLWATVNTLKKTNLVLPASYAGPNYIYAISIPLLPSQSNPVSMVTYNSNVTPPNTYPVLPPPGTSYAPCPATGKGAQTYFIITTIGATGVTIPPGINKNETVYMMRHAEAHPTQWFEDGNYVAAGQWRALDLPNSLEGKFNPIPTQIYSSDPAQAIPSGYLNWSYARPSLTVEPYAIANNLPYHLAADFEMFDLARVIPQENQFFFNNPPFSSQPLLPQQPPNFSGQTVLLAWEHSHFQPTVKALLKSYGISSQKVADWPDTDYDTIWTVKVDAVGNLTVDNYLCEGIDSAMLPATAPQF